MFREMRRKKQSLSEKECVEVLISEKRGVLSLIGDNGYPYGIPLNHWYCEENGKLYFHGAREGHKLDALKSCEKACYTVFDEGYRREGEWALNVRSVVVFGIIRLTDDPETKERVCAALSRKFTGDDAYFEKERPALPRAICLELTPEHISGKLVNES